MTAADHITAAANIRNLGELATGPDPSIAAVAIAQAVIARRGRGHLERLIEALKREAGN